MENGSLTLSEKLKRLGEFLTAHPCNYTKAAKHLGIHRREVISLVQKFEEMFNPLEDEVLDQLEEYIFLFSTGQDLPNKEIELRFDFRSAMEVLERRRPNRWIKVKKVETKETKDIQEQAKDFLSRIKQGAQNVNIVRDPDQGGGIQ